MLDPDAVTAAVVAAIQSIRDVALAVNLSPSNNSIYGHYYQSGVEPRLALAVYEMKQPSILVAYDAMLAGNFNGYDVFKHRLNVFARVANQATTPTPIGLGHLWMLICNKPVSGGNHIRLTNILLGLDIMDNPGMVIRQDEDNQDFLHGTMVFPEIGDQS